MLPERITTAEQLDELPPDTVLIVQGVVAGRAYSIALQNVGGYWMPPGSMSAFNFPDPLGHRMDVFVVWKPGQPTDGEVKA